MSITTLPAVGDTLPPFHHLVDPEAMKVWAVALHDPNPIHLDVEVVKAQGLGDRVINQGPANVAYLINMLHRAFPGGRVSNLVVRFGDNVYGGETVQASGTVTAATEQDGVARIDCDLTLVADGGRPVMSGTASVHLG